MNITEDAISIGELLTKAYEILKNENIDTYILDAQLLMAKVLDKDRLYVITNRGEKVSKKIEKEFNAFIELRKRKMPVKYILNKCEFMGMEFYIKEGVLIPRPDTEILVEEALKEIDSRGYRNLCDLCSGSGAIGVALAYHNKSVDVICYDISDKAEEVTNININRFGLQERVNFFKSDLLKETINTNTKFDMVASNPPYIKEETIPTLMEDVKNYEPYIALSGGKDGLDFYRKITNQSLQVLNKGGMLIFEIGHDQKDAVMDIMINHGFQDVEGIKDLSGKDRVVKGIKF